MAGRLFGFSRLIWYDLADWSKFVIRVFLNFSRGHGVKQGRGYSRATVVLLRLLLANSLVIATGQLGPGHISLFNRYGSTFWNVKSNNICVETWFPTMWHFDKCRLRWACATPFKRRNSKSCSFSSLTVIDVQATSKCSDQIARMRRLVWAFAGRTYHIDGNLMSWLNYHE